MSARIEVDPIRCEAHGLCAELLPERIALDEWGYPLIDPEPVGVALSDLARRAVSACPTLALRLRALGRDEAVDAARRQRRPSVAGSSSPAKNRSRTDRKTGSSGAAR
ncbi:MAG: ferredoxin [Solirubrobacteraceae bacterium]